MGHATAGSPAQPEPSSSKEAGHVTDNDKTTGAGLVEGLTL